ncbi:MAG: PepSY-associated TM helix domain-containing protein [Solirubrobacterales bacterium]
MSVSAVSSSLHASFHWLRRRLRKLIQVTHRWAALALGLILLVIVVSGTILLFKPDIEKAIEPSAYKHTGPITTQAMIEAPAQAEKQVKNFAAVDDWSHDGIITVTGTVDEKSREVNVDPGTGHVLAVSDPNGGFFGFLDNLHECALSCEDYPAYIPFLNKSAAVLGNEDLTVGGLILGLTGLLLLMLSLGGLYLWWPGVRRFSRGFKVRRKSSYSINYDLHKLVGLIAIPFLLMWAITGAGFELKQVEDAWFAVLPGSPSPEAPEFKSKPPKGVKESTVTPQQAVDAALAEAPGARLASLNVPDASDKTSSYSFWLSDGWDPYEYGNYPGDVGVNVDRYDAKHALVNYGYPNGGESIATEAWDNSYPVHSGLLVNGWWRSVWLLFGLVPILLAFTGTWTWISRKRKARAKKRFKREGYRAAGAPAGKEANDAGAPAG